MSLFTKNEPRLRFEDLQTEHDVAIALSLLVEKLQQLREENAKGPLYRPISLAKKGLRHRGQVRIVYEVDRGLQRLQREILESLRAQISANDNAYGFIRGRSTLKNAEQHHGARILLNLDIKDFFDSIKEVQVVKCFRGLGAGEAAASLLGAICCFQGRLPQGAPTSPLLSNLVCEELDARLAGLARRKRSKYTRYADDLTFSGDSVPDVDQVGNVLSAYGFSLNHDKCSAAGPGEPQYVTGLTLGSPKGVRLPNRLRRSIRSDLYRAHKSAKERAKGLHLEIPDDARLDDATLSGHLAYAYSIEPEWTLRIMKKYPLGVPDDWRERTSSDGQ